MASVTASEQLMLELINLARLDPTGEAQRLGIDLNAGLAAGTITADPKQPLAFNDLLVAAARNHSVWQIDNDVFSHIGVGSSSPGDRMAAAGYIFTGLWGWGENIAWRGVAPGPIDAAAAILLQHDALFLSPGHRTNLLNDDMREIGVGQAVGSFSQDGTDWSASIVTQDFAYSGSQLFLTGVVYQDSNGDSRYGLGEGRGNWAVGVAHAGTQTAVQTNPYGGYESAIGVGTNRISFSGSTPAVVDVQVTDQNIKLDLAGTIIRASTSLTLISGATGAELLGIASTAIDGSASPETLVGNPGNNWLAGGRGADTLDGRAGADSLSGGEGNDTLSGDAGVDEALFSGNRSEYILGRTANGFEVSDQTPDRDGTDTLEAIEILQFADRTVDLTMGDRIQGVSAADLKTLLELYVGFFNRVPEAAGLAYWIGELQSGVSLASIADQFYSAGVQYGLYSESMTLDTFIREIYENVLGRPPGIPPEQGEIDWWAQQIESGTVTRGTMVLSMLNIVHTYYEGITDPNHPNYPYQFVAAHLNNKAAVANYYAIEQGLSYHDPYMNIEFGIQLASLITPEDTSAAIDLIGVNDFSVTAALI
jgi:hypothetical protein